MPRIRTLKPELPQDEKVGSVSRDARLLWLMMFTLADDEGRFRAHPGLLASACFPYDGLSPDTVGAWCDELVRAGLVAVYRVSGQVYGAITNWSRHQRIDHPAPSKLPSPPDESVDPLSEVEKEALASSREDSRGFATDHDPDPLTGISSLSRTPLSPVNPTSTRTEAVTQLRARARSASAADAHEIFAAWCEAGGKNQSARLTRDRLGKISARFREGYSLADIRDAAVGIWSSRWNVEHGRTDLALALRDGEHLERFRDIARGSRSGREPDWSDRAAADIERGLEMMRQEQLAAQ